MIYFITFRCIVFCIVNSSMNENNMCTTYTLFHTKLRCIHFRMLLELFLTKIQLLHSYFKNHLFGKIFQVLKKGIYNFHNFPKSVWTQPNTNASELLGKLLRRMSKTNYCNSSHTIQQVWKFVMNKICQITTIIKNHVQWLAIFEDQSLLNAPNIFFIRFSFPSIDRYPSGSNCCSSKVLS